MGQDQFWKKGSIVARRLLDRFRETNVGPGDRLPAERELAVSLGVSRTVLREALSALQMAGVVESRVGDGTYISKSFNPEQPSLPPLLRNIDASISVVEAIEAREALDISAAHLAIENATEDDLSRLDAIIGDLHVAGRSGDTLRYLSRTLDLHAAIARVGGNSVLTEAVLYLIDLVRPHLWIVAANYDTSVLKHSLRIHTDIVAGIKSRDLTSVVTALKEHYRDYPSLRHNET
jgi:GntR family transcriptional repressor for pyruvate dehydrogenase complex